LKLLLITPAILGRLFNFVFVVKLLVAGWAARKFWNARRQFERAAAYGKIARPLVA
jgi:hypothetical protein